MALPAKAPLENRRKAYSGAKHELVRLSNEHIGFGCTFRKCDCCCIKQLPDFLKGALLFFFLLYCPFFHSTTPKPFLIPTYKKVSLFLVHMLGFLKRLFGYGAQQEIENEMFVVKLADLESWLLSIRAPMNEQIKARLSASRERISQISASAKEKVNALQSAQLMNPNIPDRAKDFMTGNREEYSRRVLNYLDRLSLPDSTDHLSSFFDQHADDAKEFTQGILRPFQILQEFFANESKEITSMLAQIEQQILELQAMHRHTKPEAYAPLHTEIESLIARQTQLKGLKSERSELEKQKLEAEKSIEALGSEETRLLGEHERQALLKKVGEAQQKTKVHEQKIRDVFNNFEPALRKFHRMATRNVKLMEHYIRDPVGTLIEDMHLDIIEAIADIQRLIDFDRIPLGDKKEYVIDSMNLLNKQYLGTWLREYGQLTKAEKDAQTAVDECTASKTLVRIQKLRDDTKRNKHVIELRLSNILKDIAKINLESMKSKLEENLKNTTGRQITVTF